MFRYWSIGKTLQSAQTQYWWLIKYQYKLDETSQHVKFNSETKHQRKPNWQKLLKKQKMTENANTHINAILKICCYIVICCQYVMNISFVIWYDDIRVRGVKGFYFPINCQWQINSWYWSELYTDGLRLGLESNLYDRLFRKYCYWIILSEVRLHFEKSNTNNSL